ncbi:hypothetical protein U1Q18_038967 [Sarracenia purpurea var. burkii]
MVRGQIGVAGEEIAGKEVAGEVTAIGEVVVGLADEEFAIDVVVGLTENMSAVEPAFGNVAAVVGGDEG